MQGGTYTIPCNFVSMPNSVGIVPLRGLLSIVLCSTPYNERHIQSSANSTHCPQHCGRCAHVGHERGEEADLCGDSALKIVRTQFPAREEMRAQ